MPLNTPEITVLSGHTSAESAHITYAYPFGRTRCLRREWVEQAEKGAMKGQSRFVTQTTTKAFNSQYTDRIQRDGIEMANAWADTMLRSPNAVAWNKPNASTYAPVVVMVSAPLPDGSGRIGIDYRSLQEYPSLETLNAFRALLNTGNPGFSATQQQVFDRIVRRTEAAALREPASA